jgi:hypothetical protein
MNVVHIDRPFKVTELPLKDIYVLDNYLCTELWHHFDQQICSSSVWSKTNQVGSDSPTGLPHHQFWGATYYREDGRIEHGMESKYLSFPYYLNRRLQMEFGFKWVRFQYMGLNSQTQGLQGTTHSDCSDEDEWNISFLYYPNRFWNPKWGGSLRIYDEHQRGIDGRDEHIKNHQIAEVEFKPNRLIMFDGRIPHGADAPHSSARYIDRRSLVLRGDEVRLVDEEEFFYANDRLSHI